MIGAKWLWEEENLKTLIKTNADEDGEFSLDAYLNEFWNVAAKAGEEVRELAKLAKTIIENKLQAEGKLQNILAEQLKTILQFQSQINPEGSALSKAFYSFGKILESSTSVLLNLHRKTYDFLNSDILANTSATTKRLEGSMSAWSNRMLILKKDIVLISGEIIKIKENYHKSSTEARAKKRGSGFYHEDLVLLNQNNETYKQGVLLENSQKKLRELVVMNTKDIRTEIMLYRENDIKEQLVLSNLINGILSESLQCWEQYSELMISHWKKLSSIKTDEIIKASATNLKLSCPPVSEIFKYDSPEIEVKIEGEDCIVEKEGLVSKADEVNLTASLNDQQPSRNLVAQLHKAEYDIEIGMNDTEDKNSKKNVLPRTKEILVRSDIISESTFDDVTGLSSGNGWLYCKFGVKDPIIESYSCAVSWKIILHGRLYITRSSLCFHSLFNNSTLFGRDTRIILPLGDIIKIEKRFNAIIFDNSIAVKMEKAELFFTSFVFRDKCFSLIQKCIEENRNGYEGTPNNASIHIFHAKKLIKQKSASKSLLNIIQIKEENNLNPYIKIISEIEEQRLKEIEQIEKIIFHNDRKEVIFDEEFDCPIQVIFPALNVLSHKIAKKKEEFHHNSNIVIEQETQHPDYFTSYKNALGFIIKYNDDPISKIKALCASMPLKSFSKEYMTHGLTVVLPIPFFPDKCTLHNEHKAYYISPNFALTNCKTNAVGIPFGDYFYTHTQENYREKIEQDPNGTVRYKTRVTVYMYFEFVKSTIFHGTITSEAFKEASELYRDKIGPALREYVPGEMKRFEQFAERIASKGSQSIIPFHSKLPKHSVQKLLIMDMKSKSAQLSTLKNVMANQRKIYFGLVSVGAILVMILVVQFIYYTRNR